MTNMCWVERIHGILGLNTLAYKEKINEMQLHVVDKDFMQQLNSNATGNLEI